MIKIIMIKINLMEKLKPIEMVNKTMKVTMMIINIIITVPILMTKTDFLAIM